MSGIFEAVFFHSGSEGGRRPEDLRDFELFRLTTDTSLSDFAASLSG
jgi:hypothetical protein